jgi:hypothetical protein
MNMSTERVGQYMTVNWLLFSTLTLTSDRKLVKLYDITDLPEGESVAFRARIHHLRAVGKDCLRGICLIYSSERRP